MATVHFWDGAAWQTTSGPAPLVPPAPSAVTVTPADSEATVSWGSVSGADTYTVYRSTTSGSGYSSVQSGLATTSYTDTTTTNETTYYYVVTATNINGESSNSAEVSTTPAAAVITLNPSSASVATGQNLTVRVMVNSHTNNMDTVQVRLTFDPAQLSYVSRDGSASAFDTSAPFSQGSGYVEIIRGNTSPLTGSQVFVDVTFQALTDSGTATIGYDAVETVAIYAGTGLSTSGVPGEYSLTA